jgi:hypothetical protein
MSRIPHISEPLFDAGTQKVNDNWFRFLDGLVPVIGTWTPVLTFATPGDLSVAYTTQRGSYERIGRLVHAVFAIDTSAFTHTTASGALTISGLPFTSAGTATRSGTVSWSGITKANYTEVVPRVVVGVTTIVFTASGSGQARDAVIAGNVPSAGNVVLSGEVFYQAA